MEEKHIRSRFVFIRIFDGKFNNYHLMLDIAIILMTVMTMFTFYH